MVATITLLQLLALAPAAVIGAALADNSTFNIADLTLREVGARNTLDWRIWLEKDGNPISFWHDVPLYPNPEEKNIIHFYTEIPRWTDGKVETKRDEPLNPIFHDDKSKKPRFVESVWPHKTYPFNYGSIPQTWEDPNHPHEFTGFPGDNDPVDIFEISSLTPSHVGQVKAVKILGGLAMIDDEATDWKVVAIDIEDPLADLINSIEDIDTYRPGLRQAFYDWFIYYKVVRGNGVNTIVGEDYQNATFVTKIIEESHAYWEDLVKGKSDPNEIALNQTSHPRWCSTYVPSEEATDVFELPTESEILPAAARPEAYDLWYYLDANFELIELPGQ